MKGYFANPEVENEAERDDVANYTMLMLSPQTSASKEELLERLPEKSIVDRLVSRYFNSHSPSLREWSIVVAGSSQQG